MMRMASCQILVEIVACWMGRVMVTRMLTFLHLEHEQTQEFWFHKAASGINRLTHASLWCACADQDTSVSWCTFCFRFRCQLLQAWSQSSVRTP